VELISKLCLRLLLPFYL